MSKTILSPAGVTARTGFAAQTLANWRSEKKGPKSFHIGRLVRYYESDVDAWVIAQATA